MAAEGHGKLAPLSRHRASMGPRPDGRGRNDADYRVHWRCDASMGPRPDGRGRHTRTRMDARGRRASMGPRPDGRGRKADGRLSEVDSELQWGRGRMAAEGGATVGALGMKSICFNGAAAGWPRKANDAAHDALRRGSFNGAAAGWPRKVARRATLNRRRPASMGPRPDGRGRRPAVGSLCLRPLRFNGAAAGWPRKVMMRSWSRTGWSSFNGAAAGWPRKA